MTIKEISILGELNLGKTGLEKIVIRGIRLGMLISNHIINPQSQHSTLGIQYLLYYFILYLKLLRKNYHIIFDGQFIRNIYVSIKADVGTYVAIQRLKKDYTLLYR